LKKETAPIQTIMITTKAKQNIPKGWQKKQIKDLLDYERPDKYIVESDRYISSGIPVLTANKSFILGYTDEKDGVYENIPAIIFDDFTTDSKFVDFPFKIKSSAIKILKEKGSDIDLRFVYEKMKSVSFPTGNHKRYYISQYQNMDVVVPPLPEQKKIAEILGAVDEEIQRTDEIISATEKLKRGLMQQLFTRGIGHTKFKKTEVGEIPEGWQRVKLEDVAEVVMGQSPVSSSYNQDGVGTPFFQGKADFTPSYKTRVRYWTDQPSKFAEPDDVLLSVRAPVGDVAINEMRACIGRGLAAVRAKKEVAVQDFLFQLLLSLKNELNSKAQGSTFTAINGPALREVVVSLPPTDEQQKIAEILSAVDKKISVNQKLKDKLILLKKGLMQDLLSGKVRVKS